MQRVQLQWGKTGGKLTRTYENNCLDLPDCRPKEQAFGWVIRKPQAQRREKRGENSMFLQQNTASH